MKTIKKKIAIIGGGFAGIHFSRLINKNLSGCSVDLYERNPTLGGKIDTYLHEGHSYDLGAITGVRQVYREVEAMFGKSFNTKKITTSVFHSASNPSGNLFTALDRGKLIWQLIKYLLLRAYFGTARVKSVSDLPFSEFCQLHHLPLVEVQFRAIFCGCGYGSNKRLPTYYVFHHAGFSLLVNLYFGGFRFYPEGLQNLLIKNFKNQHPNTKLHLNQSITNIIKANHQLVLMSKHTLLGTYDAVILACNPTLLTLHEAAARLFSKLNYFRYNVSLLEFENLYYPTPHVISFENNMDEIRDHMPVMIFFTHPNKTTGLTYYYSRDLPNEKLLTEALHQSGFKVNSIITSRQYENYFPHFTAPSKVEVQSIQGKDHLYYIGESTTFSVLPAIANMNKEVFSLLKSSITSN